MYIVDSSQQNQNGGEIFEMAYFAGVDKRVLVSVRMEYAALYLGQMKDPRSRKAIEVGRDYVLDRAALSSLNWANSAAYDAWQEDKECFAALVAYAATSGVTMIGHNGAYLMADLYARHVEPIWRTEGESLSSAIYFPRVTVHYEARRTCLKVFADLMRKALPATLQTI